jgi:hypothetical protein
MTGTARHLALAQPNVVDMTTTLDAPTMTSTIDEAAEAPFMPNKKL